MQQNILTQFDLYLTGKGFSNKTKSNILHAVTQFERWTVIQNLKEINSTTYGDILFYIKYCNAIGNKKKTVYMKLLFLRHFFDYLLKEKIIDENPVAGIQLQGMQKTRLHHILSPKELYELYESYPSLTITDNRNKAILGLLVFQGLRVEEIKALQVKDIILNEGKLVVALGGMGEGRILRLQTGQIICLNAYINKARKNILKQTHKKTDKLFVSLGSSYDTQNAIRKFMLKLKKMDDRIKNLGQIRASVITRWVKHYNLREAQYMAGHRYVSSTEKYKVNDLDGLIDDVRKFHPLN